MMAILKAHESTQKIYHFLLAGLLASSLLNTIVMINNEEVEINLQQRFYFKMKLLKFQ